MENTIQQALHNLLPESDMTVQRWIEMLNHVHLPTFTSEAHLKALLCEVISTIDFTQPPTAEVKEKLLFFNNPSSSFYNTHDTKAALTSSKWARQSEDVLHLLHIFQAFELLALKPFQKLLLYLNILLKLEDTIKVTLEHLKCLLFCDGESHLTFAETLLLRQIARESFKSGPSSLELNNSLQRLYQALMQGWTKHKIQIAKQKAAQQPELSCNEEKNKTAKQFIQSNDNCPKYDMEKLQHLMPDGEKRIVDWSLFSYMTQQSEKKASDLPKIKTVSTTGIPLVSTDGTIKSPELLISNIKQEYNDNIPTTFSSLFQKIPSHLTTHLPSTLSVNPGVTPLKNIKQTGFYNKSMESTYKKKSDKDRDISYTEAQSITEDNFNHDMERVSQIKTSDPLSDVV